MSMVPLEMACQELVALAGRMVGDDDLAVAHALEELSTVAKELAAAMVVDAVRCRRVSWVTVADAFGLTRQGAMKRFQR